MSQDPPIGISVGPGRLVRTTPAYDSYWRFAAKRQAMFMRRVGGTPPPWTDDPVLTQHRFTNAYRAADRVSQFLIRNVIYAGSAQGEEVFFRTLLFKFFNRIDVWKNLTEKVGPISWKTYEFDRYANALDSMMGRGERIYSAAYIMPSPAFGNARKHRNHLRLLEFMMKERAPQRLSRSGSLKEAFELLRSFPSLGDFLAFQFAIDLNYSELIDFSEMEFVVPGPGARDGISKCFTDGAGLSEAELIRVVAERAEYEFRRLGLEFKNLWGRPLQLIDCQNLFCELSKYARVVHPDIKGESGRTRIKQKFARNPEPLPQWYPPKWGLNPTPPATPASPPARQQRLSFEPRCVSA